MILYVGCMEAFVLDSSSSSEAHKGECRDNVRLNDTIALSYRYIQDVL